MPDIGDILRHPEMAARLSIAERQQLLAQATGLILAIGLAPVESVAHDRGLTKKQVAEKLGKSMHWFYRNQHKLDFAKRGDGIYSERALDDYLRGR